MTTSARVCHLCRDEAVTRLMDLGTQPVCNRFLTAPSDDQFLHPMVIGQCQDCGLVQIIDPVPAEELMPQVDWITYNEPEEHLDRMAQIIRDLPGIATGAAICGISFKDDSILARLEVLGIKNAWRIQPERDLAIGEAGAGVETIQWKLTPETAARIAQSNGLADVVIARHILEHAHHTLNFTKAVKNLVKPNGYIVFEVPDCTKSMENFDYSCPWEEHILYFTSETFKRGLALCDMPLVSYASYPYDLEDSLVAIVRRGSRTNTSQPADPVSGEERARATGYAQALQQHRERYQSYLSDFQRNQGKVALLGAGHLACTFINLLELKNYFEFIVDDNPHKRGLFMPGSRLPIVGSEALVSEEIKLCLLSVHPQVENRVIENNQRFAEHGGAFVSMFPNSNLAMKT